MPLTIPLSSGEWVRRNVGPILRLSATSIAEGASGRKVGDLSVSNGSGTYTFSITADPDSKFTIANDVELTLDATLDYETDVSHSVTIEADNGVDDPVSRLFTITVTDVDEVAPTVLSFSPADNATLVATDTDLIVTFSEIVVLGASGVITLKRTSDDVTIDSWDVSADEGIGAGQVDVLDGDKLHLHITTALAASEEFYIIWDAGVVEDVAGNAVAALSTTTTWSFTTGITLAALTVDTPVIEDASPEDTQVGNIIGITSGSTVTLFDDAGGRFKKTGTEIFAGAVATDYATATSHNITLRETIGDATNSPRDSVIAITVEEAVDLTPAAPVLTLTSAAGEESPTFNVDVDGTKLWGVGQIDVDHKDQIEVEAHEDSGFTSLEDEDTYTILEADLGDEEFAFTSLGPLTAGAKWYRARHNNIVAGVDHWSAWSTGVTDTVVSTSSYFAAFYSARQQ